MAETVNVKWCVSKVLQYISHTFIESYNGFGIYLTSLSQTVYGIVHLFRGPVAYVYWIDTVYVQNNLSALFSKRTNFKLSKKIC